MAAGFGIVSEVSGSAVARRDAPWYLKKPQAWQSRLLRRPWLLPVAAMHLAAVIIQKAWRRSWLRAAAQPRFLLGPGSGPPRGWHAGAGTSFRTRRRSIGKEVIASLRWRYSTLLRRHIERDGTAGYETFEHFCAALIQSRWRARKEVRSVWRLLSFGPLKIYHVAAFEIQKAWLEHLRLEEARERKRPATVRVMAVRRIQRAWRSVLDCRFYWSLRDTIAIFRRTGDPCLLLRSILPREWMLLDAAMQVHLRFRLGGSRFPPAIYYKIYTHGAIVDLGAFAPRNYAAERAGRPETELERYERAENNGWRPLVTRIPTSKREAVPDEVEKNSARKAVKNFHYSRLRRRQDMEKQRRRRTVEWMRKLYGLEGEGSRPETNEEDSSSARLGGLGHSESLDEPSQKAAVPRPPSSLPPSARAPRRVRPRQAAALPENARSRADRPQTASDISVEQSREDIDDEHDDHGDAAALLEWSRVLDFDAYMDDWQKIATTNDSEGILPLSIPLGRTMAVAH